jgi:transposase InsO family protein
VWSAIYLTTSPFQQLLHKYNTKQSFSQPGKPHDNAVAESFFASLKKEELYRKDHPFAIEHFQAKKTPV